MTRIGREKQTVAQMITLFCRNCHGSSGQELCDNCRALMSYAMQRLDRCPHGESKTSCRKCKTHCYAPMQREKIREVMRYAGPRMILVHPVSAIRHIIREL